MGSFPVLPIGLPCATCDDLLWIEGHTPSIIIATFEGIKKGLLWNDDDEEPQHGNFTLHQDGFMPCWYFGSREGFFVELYFYGAQTLLRLSLGGGMGVQFESATGKKCSVSFWNLLGETVPTHFEFGRAIITW